MVSEGQMMDAGAARYMKNCNDFLAAQNAAMREEFNLGDVNLEEGLEKIYPGQRYHRLWAMRSG